jgi:uncharacterized protein (DUF58 family)
MLSAVRILVAIVAAILIAVGVLTIILGQPLSGGWMLILGVIGIVVALYERRRYGSERPAGVDSRFRPTEEVFLDPSSGQRMRVHVDPRSGERLYVSDPREPDRPGDR